MLFKFYISLLICIVLSIIASDSKISIIVELFPPFTFVNFYFTYFAGRLLVMCMFIIVISSREIYVFIKIYFMELMFVFPQKPSPLIW